ncbi:cortactin-binding protein 2 [Lates japonicus]|uniref:Cortactin-binding protein 2 n=1 Tax=Lates japonicus TaxID=270547 RepID=A0AAD3NB76_LATJO|nr:cortactin-binding protein 2 [Lates japonicus]
MSPSALERRLAKRVILPLLRWRGPATSPHYTHKPTSSNYVGLSSLKTPGRGSPTAAQEDWHRQRLSGGQAPRLTPAGSSRHQPPTGGADPRPGLPRSPEEVSRPPEPPHRPPVADGGQDRPGKPPLSSSQKPGLSQTPPHSTHCCGGGTAAAPGRNNRHAQLPPKPALDLVPARRLSGGVPALPLPGPNRALSAAGSMCRVPRHQPRPPPSCSSSINPSTSSSAGASILQSSCAQQAALATASSGKAPTPSSWLLSHCLLLFHHLFHSAK